VSAAFKAGLAVILASRQFTWKVSGAANCFYPGHEGAGTVSVETPIPLLYLEAAGLVIGRRPTRVLEHEPEVKSTGEQVIMLEQVERKNMTANYRCNAIDSTLAIIRENKAWKVLIHYNDETKYTNGVDVLRKIPTHMLVG